MNSLCKLAWTAFSVLLIMSMAVVPFAILVLIVQNAKIEVGYRTATGDVDGMLSASVMIQAAGSAGSGVAFKNGSSVFVWTAAHVVAGAATRVEVKDKFGQSLSHISFADILLTQECTQDGRKTGSQTAYAKVIRYSERQDLALLKVRMAWPKGSVTFAGDSDATVGQPVWHVGSISGPRGCNSLTEGIVSARGRLRVGGSPEEVASSDVYDQLAVTAHPGSSGGGIFLKSTNTPCIGLVIEFLGPGNLPGVLCIAPVRRMRAFAMEAKCLWAMSAEVPVPDSDDEPVVQDHTPVVPVVP